VTTENLYDADGDGTVGSPGDQRWPLAGVDVQLIPNGVTRGSLTVTDASTFASPDSLAATLNSEMEVTITWTGGVDLDLAIWEYDPAAFTFQWSTPKTGALWGNFSGDDTGADPTHAEER